MGYSWSNGRKVMALALRLAMVPLRLITLFFFFTLSLTRSKQGGLTCLEIECDEACSIRRSVER